MSVFKPTGSKVWYCKFRRGGRAVSFSTQETSKARAKAFERAEKIKAEQMMRAERETGRRPMTVDRCFALYADEVLAHRPSGDQRLALLHWLEDQLGKDTALADLTPIDIAALIKARRACTKRSGKDDKGRALFKPVTVATVNRTIQCLRAALYHARDQHGAMLSAIKLQSLRGEPKERVRAATPAEEAAIFAALREDFHDVTLFALLTGIRCSGCVSLQWPMVDFAGGTLRYSKKREAGGAIEPGHLPITPEVEAILRRQLGHDRLHVWTYLARPRGGVKRAGKGEGVRHAGVRYPITFSNLQTQWKRALKKAGVADFRFHDLRHTAATRLLKATGNLKMGQVMLGHSSIVTTGKYAHVLQEDLRAGMTRAQEAARSAQRPAASDAGSQGFSQGLPKLKVVE